MQYTPKPYTSKTQMKMSARVSNMGFIVEDDASFPPYFIDIFLIEFHLGIECDGHWSHKLRKSKDPQRDRFLMETYSLPIIRFPKMKDCTLEHVMDFINKWDDSVEERKQKNLDARSKIV